MYILSHVCMIVEQGFTESKSKGGKGLLLFQDGQGQRGSVHMVCLFDPTENIRSVYTGCLY